MSLTDDEIVLLVRELVRYSYASARPPGMRGLRGSDLLDLARERFGEAVSESELDAAVTQVGGHAVELATTRDLLGSVLRRRRRWRRAYLVPSRLFGGLELPSRLRPPPTRPTA